VYSGFSGLAIGAVLALGTWTPVNQDLARNLTIYNGLLVILLGAIFLLPGTLDNVTDRVAVSLMIAGLSLSSASAILDTYFTLPTGLARVIRIARFPSIVLVVIGCLFYFSRFRAADLFAKRAVRLLLARRWPCWELFWSLARFDRSRERPYLRWLPRFSVGQPLPAAPCCSLPAWADGATS